MKKEIIVPDFKYFVEELINFSTSPKWQFHIETVKQGGRDLSCDNSTLELAKIFLKAVRKINVKDVEKEEATVIIKAYDKINFLMNESRQISMSEDTFGDTLISKDMDPEAYEVIARANQLVAVESTQQLLNTPTPKLGF